MKKLLSLIVLFALVLTQVGLVYADQAKVDAANTAAALAKKDSESLNAWLAYLKDPKEENFQNLAKTFGKDPTKFKYAPDFNKGESGPNELDTDLAGLRTRLQQNKADQALIAQLQNPETNLQKLDDTTIKSLTTLSESQKKISDQKATEARYEQRNLNSEKIAEQYKGTPGADAAEKIRTVQDLQDYKALGCGPAGTETRSVCREIRERRGIDEINYQSALNNATKAVQGIEAGLQKELKDKLETQTVNVSKILSFQSGDNKQTSYIPNGDNPGGALYFISRMIDVLVIVVSSVAVVTLIIGGYMFMFSGGDEQQRENGKDVLIYTVFGLIFVYASYAIVSLIQGLIYF